MASQIEAQSLSELNALAANPPQYPVNPTEAPRESLVLYISRVPGTRDIILSTFRPQRKNVTASDVANSLYYVHLNSVYDEALASPPPHPMMDSSSPRSSYERPRVAVTSFDNQRAPIPRKPLPSVQPGTAPPPAPLDTPSREAVSGTTSAPTPPLSLGRSPPKADGYGSPNTRGTSTPPRRPVQAERSDPPREEYAGNPMFRHNRPPRMSSEEQPELPPRVPPKQPQAAGGLVARKPLGPRPPPHLSLPNANPPALMSPPYRSPYESSSRDPFYSGPQEPPLPRTPAAHSGPPSPMPKLGGEKAAFAPFSLTIIRREPASGHQWNIGKVSSYQTNIPTPDQADPNLDPNDLGVPRGISSIDVHLETSGYAKFRDMPTRHSVETASRPMSSSSAAQGSLNLRSSIDEAAARHAAMGTLQGSEGFSRQVMMAYSKSWASNIKNAFRRRGSSPNSPTGGFPEDLAPPRPFHVRHGSSNSVASVESAASKDDDDGRDSPPLITRPGPGLKPRGYVFMSPWDGRCEFHTGNGGRSLKCRHKLQPANAVFNPLVASQAIRDGQAIKRARNTSVSAAITGAKPISELRYNLPNGELFGSSKKGDGHHHLHDHFSKLLNLEPNSDDDDDDGPMDLSIGREKAGGGNRGKRAKLGKLIIHHEGLKMLDLVVAANIGVWWTTWERRF
ncbi:hypothetical protein GQ53DRAFT_743871 [Thozetella sp. PMI_491]|nr:hypothetical protein GQ53DRAFT_743871 [Thozetella sp. PMI_491]